MWIKSFLFALAVFAVLSALTYDEVYAQGRDRSKYKVGFDTSTVRNDTSKNIDTNIVKAPVDSTARIKNFKYDRKDHIHALFGEYESPILLYNSTLVERQVTFDSLNNVIITEKVSSEDIRYPIKIPFDKYITIESDLSQKNQLYKIVADFYKIETADELEQLFKNITEITIPLPFSSETIFGPPTINLKINGVIDITASYQRSTTDQQTISQTPTQNNINFKQDVQVTTKGSVGDKLTIDADWNSQRTFDFENQLKLKYKGYPDEVVQSIEAGNVSLETKSNLIGSTQALFGVKAAFKLGPLTLTAIASQKKSEQKEVDITGGSVETPIGNDVNGLNIVNYSENNYLLDESYSSNFTAYYTAGTYSIDVQKIEVWVYAEPNNPQRRSNIGYTDLTPKTSINYYDSLRTAGDVDGVRMSGNFIKLDPSEYTLNRYAGYITLSNYTATLGKDAIAVAYTVSANGQTPVQYGDYANEVSSTSKLVLKMLRPNYLQAPNQDAAHGKLWSRMLKNIYNTGVRNIKNDASNITVKIVRKPPAVVPQESYVGPSAIQGQTPNGKSWLTLTKLDLRAGITPGTQPDGNFDFLPNQTIDLANGNIIFPDLRPFSNTLRVQGVPDSVVGTNDSIYTNSKITVGSFSNPVIFYITGTVKGEASNKYSLGFNVVEGSVKVFNGSVELVSGADYTIDYSTGELLIRNASALAPGAQLKITYESNDLFTLASKTLLGTRAEFQINKTSYLGFTLINLKQQTLNDKVRIGEEPTNNTLIGFDAATDFKVNFLTKLVNKIPGYNTKEESSVTLNGEIAFMLPDPNTKKSLIPGDNGESVAYIDDFEGAKKLIPLGLNPLSWTLASMPIDNSIVPNYGNISQVAYDSLMSNRRSRLYWFTLINNVPITDVYPQRTVATNQNQNLSPFVFDINPSFPGMYNFLSTPTYQSNYLADLPHNWSGVFRFLNTSQTNLVDENVNYIEIWMKIGNPANFEGNFTGEGDTANFNSGDSAKVIVDLGSISERIIGWPQIKPETINNNTDYHTEDYNLDGQLSLSGPRGTEDNGITGWTSDEKGAWGNTHGFINQTNGQPNGDDPSNPFRDRFTWTQSSSDYSGFNGTWLNATNLSEAKRPDQEDLNNNGHLDLQNSYFEYEIPIDLNSIRQQKDIAGGGNKGWYQFVIPLSQFTNAQGIPTLTNIQYTRIWFKGLQKEVMIKIADMNLVGNQWVKLDKNDTTYTVGVVSIEENPNIYQSPVPGNVLRQRDQSQTDQNVLSNEQSMSLEVRRLLPGQTKYVQKTFATRPLDLINYKILKLFIDGDPTFKYFDTSRYDASMVIRIGYDTANFYEYRAPIHPDPRPGSPWSNLNEVSINLADMTAIKQSIDSTKLITYINVPNGPPGSKYGIRGSPSIRNVNNIYLGVANSNTGPVVTTPITGSVWFNEMRVLKTNDNSGYAYTMGAKIKVADLAAIDISYSKTDPNFHSLEDRFGSLSNTNSWQISGTFNAHKLINALLSRYLSLKFKNFINMPITFSHQEDYNRPQYLPNSDVSLATAMQNVRARYTDPTLGNYYANQLEISTQTLTVTNRFSINGFKINLPGESFLVQQMINKIEVSFSRNSTTQRSPTDESKYAWDMAGTVGMSSAIPLLDMYHLNIGKLLPFGDEFKDAKLYFFFPYMPLAPLFTNNLSLGSGFTRSHGDEKLRAQLEANPTTRSFGATRNFNLDWKFIEGWVVDVTGNYAFNAGSDLTYLETTSDSIRNQRSNSQILNDIFFGVHLINFGHDQNYSQTISINPKLNIPGLRNFVDLTTTYRSAYGWRPNDLGTQYGSTVGFSSDMETSAFLKLNQIFNLFKGSGKDDKKGGSFSSRYQDDKRGIGEILKMLGTFVPDQITISLSQSRQATNPSVAGRPGFANFWMDGFGSKNDNGPSRLYQLGWTDNPGSRIPGLTFNDNLTQNNTITLNTFITPIFPNNLKISFQYKVTTDKTKNSGYTSDLFGNIGSPLSVNDSRTITRPSFFVNSDIISQLAAPYDSISVQGKQMSDAFDKGFIKFPFPTWNLTLTGIEKFEMFSGFANTITLESGYSSEYTKQYVNDGFKPEYVTRQALNAGFSPLIGLNINFKPISDGILTAQFKLSKTDNYALSVDNANLTFTATSDLSINASYTKSGFSLPFFGLALKNDLTISFSYTRTKNDPLVYTYQDGQWNPSPLNGSINTSLNPAIQYALSKSVSVSIFYKYTKLEPTSGTIQTTASSSNEAGLNVKLTIQ